MIGDERAVGQVFSFMVGGFLLVGCIGTLLVATAGTGAHGPGDAEAEAGSVADLLVNSAGDADGGRLGLAAPGADHLDPAALDALRGAGMTADAGNNLTDYEEALGSLGMAGYDFHLTIAPVGLATQLAELDLSGIRTAYIGRWSSAPSAEVPDGPGAVAAARLQVDSTMSSVAGTERAALSALGLGFSDDVLLESTQLDVYVSSQPRRHITEAAASAELQGDVLPDVKQYLTNVLPARLPNYDVLVVGSGVQHSTLTADAAKTTIRDWVLAGGTLIVLGSETQTTQWLQPLFSAGTSSVNGGAYAPHVDHPILREPYPLAWTQYPTPPRAWDVGTQDTVDDFEQVIVAGDGALLAISRPGSFGDGRIFLTSYQPGVLAGSFGQAEAEAFLHNTILHMDRGHLYLEYGAMPPWGAAVGSTVRHTSMPDDELGLLPVRVVVLVWKA